MFSGWRWRSKYGFSNCTNHRRKVEEAGKVHSSIP
jgi:hypothetical protein